MDKSVNRFIIRHARLDEIEEIANIEAVCFPPEEAANLDMFKKRFAVFGECYYVADVDGKLAGQVNGCITDKPELPDELYHDPALHKKNGDYQTIFGLTVLPEYQHQGIAQALMNFLIQEAKDRRKKGVVLTCKDEKITFYEQMGFIFQGVSASTHGGSRWNDMLLMF